MKKVLPIFILIVFLLVGGLFGIGFLHSQKLEDTPKAENSSHKKEEEPKEETPLEPADPSVDDPVEKEDPTQEKPEEKPNSNTNSNSHSNSNSSSNSNNTPKDTRTVSQKVEDAMNSLTLDEKIAQMLIISYNGSTMSSGMKSTLTKYKPGGFILFPNNITTYQNTLKLIQDMQNTAKIPMFISIDQEGGGVQRLKSLTSPQASYIPAMPLLGKTKTTLAHDVGIVIAEELRTLGINMDFAPVIDVMDNAKTSFMKNRSFGTDPTLVANMGISLAKGLQEKGVIPVYKHFPGHGGTSTDSHYDLPVLKKTKEELYETDLIPFQKAIASNADVIMVGHLSIPKVDSKYPSSLSKIVITDLLKNELGYKGVIVTDALNMGALTDNYTERQIYELAINAGVDILLMPKSPANAIKYIKEDVQSGKISESRIDESVRKILTLKYTRIEENTLSKSFLGSKAHQTVINKIPKS